MRQITIRQADVEEAQALSALCYRSKSHWGYDEKFMALSRASLTITPTLIASGRVMVAEAADGALLGMTSIAILPEEGCYDLLHLFVEPSAIRAGAGRVLFQAAVAKAKALGARVLLIQSDPHAAGFYRSMGARDAGEAPSDSVPGRMLPMFRYALD